MDSASLWGNGSAGVSGRGKDMWVWKKVTLPVWLVVLLGKYHGKEKKKKVENGVEESNFFFHIMV